MPTGTPVIGASNAGGVAKNAILNEHRCQGHREFPFGNSREFPGILRKLRSVIFFPVISLFVQFHYHLQQLLSVNYNVLSIKLPTVKLKKKQKQAYMYKKRELT